MKFSVFLFLLFFTLTTSKRRPSKVILVTDKNVPEEINVPLSKIIWNHKNSLIITWENSDEIRMFYLLGAQTSSFHKVNVASIVAHLLRHYFTHSNAPVRITRKISDPKIDNLKGQLKLATVYEKIPRLYKVEPANIYQIPLECEYLTDTEAFVLHNGSTVTIYQSSSTYEENIIKARLFADYIVKFEEEAHAVKTTISVEASEDIYKQMTTLSESVFENNGDSLPKSDVKNSKDNNKFVSFMDELIKVLENYYQSIKDKYYYQSVKDRLSVDTSSDFTPTHSASSSTTSTSSSAASTSTATDIASKKEAFKEKIKQITGFYSNMFMAWCPPQEIPEMELNTVKSICSYMWVYFSSNEFYVYIGKSAEFVHYEFLLKTAEVFAECFTNMKITFVTDGFLLPPPFILHYGDELEKHVGFRNSIKTVFDRS